MKSVRVLKHPYLVAALWYLAIVVYVFWPILWPAPGTLVFGDDIHRSYHFFRQLFGESIGRGEFPWWNPYLFSGEPFIANPSLAFWYPVNWLFAVLPYRFVYSWIIPLHIFWAMLGMYVLLHGLSSRPLSSPRICSGEAGRDPAQEGMDSGVRRNDIFQLGSWLAGLVFGLSGFFMGRIWEGHIELILSASWMPWVVWGAVRAMRALAGVPSFSHHQGPNHSPSHHSFFTKAVMMLETSRLPAREIVLVSILLALQIFAGYQTMAMMTLIAVGIVSLSQCVSSRTVKPLFVTGLSVIIGLGLSAIQILPGQEFFRASIRTYDLPYSWAVFGSYTVQNLKQLIDPFIFGFPWDYKGPSPNFGEMAAYMGKGGLVLAILAIIVLISQLFRKVFNRITNYELGSMNKETFIFALSMICIAIFGLWVSFGWNAPIDFNKILWDIVPMYKYLRIPSRHLILFVFGMSALAGLGNYYLFSYLLSSGLTRGSLKLFIVGFIVVEMVWFARTFVVLRPDPATRYNAELIQLLLPPRCRGYNTPEVSDACLYRILPNFNVGMGTRDALDFDAAMGYRMFNASGYDPAILRNYYEFAAAVAGIENPDVQQTDVQIPYLRPPSRYVDFLNVKYMFVPSWFDSVAGSSAKYKLVMEENKKDYFRLYENAKVLPRFYLASTIVGLPNREAIARAIRTGEYDPGNVVLVQQNDVPTDSALNCARQPLPPVVMTEYSMNKIILNTDAPCNAVLATSEVMYPGWTATIDGNPTKLIEGNLAFRTIFIPKGKHTIVMAYRPTVFIVGFFVSVTTFLGCLIWLKKRV
ncbi:YfhO family protein [Candidatus Gottesmanbacteria bacterium]|nr:YfhO family protein [Candidatus Gottesmanbacteria bacterium]